jgi:hypothetical protein
MTNAAKQQGGTLDGARAALERWRRAHGGRGRPIPPALWSDAARVARAHGVEATARALRVNPTKLARLVGMAPRGAGITNVAAEAATFVELDGLRLGGGRREAGAVIELVGRDGERMRIEVMGEVRGVDVGALARAFWSRAS